MPSLSDLFCDADGVAVRLRSEYAETVIGNARACFSRSTQLP